MKVWIVQNIIKPEELEVFDNEQAAMNHRKNWTHKWKLTNIFEKEVLGI